MDLDSNSHSVFKLQYHLILVTKYRHKCITPDILLRLKEISKNIIVNNWSCKLIEIEGEDDHLHILFEAYPHINLAELVRNLKSVSSRLIRKEFIKHVRKYYWKPTFWSPSYCILSSGGAPIEVIKEYIRSQEKPKV